MVLLVLCSASFGYFISSIFDQEETAVAIAPVIMMPIMLFSGFFSNAGSYPDWIGWIQYISPIKYSLEAMIWNQFDSSVYADAPVNLITFLDY